MRPSLITTAFVAATLFLVTRPAIAQVTEDVPAPGGIEPERSVTGHPWLGLSARTVNEIDTAMMPVSVANGARVTHVEPGSPASRAGLRAGDVIIAVESAPVARACEIAELLQQVEPGMLVNMTYVREGVTAEEPVRIAPASGAQAETISRGCGDRSGQEDDASQPGEATGAEPLTP